MHFYSKNHFRWIFCKNYPNAFFILPGFLVSVKPYLIPTVRITEFKLELLIFPDNILWKTFYVPNA